ncbi:MAG: DUF47 family protein [Thaumarchaeota archaeon]|nr:DUF47 family protein [Nitrososphaerota archaeon]
MFSGEPEILARRRTLSVLQDEVRRVLDAARELPNCYAAMVKGDAAKTKEALNKIMKAEDDVENHRRMLTKEVTNIGTMMMNREDLLRAAFDVEEVSGYITGIAFRISQLKNKVLKKGELQDLVAKLIDVAVEAVQRLNEVARAVAINPTTAVELAVSVQKVERQMDELYRGTELRIMEEVDSVKDLILLKDIAGALEDMTDRCMAASDSMTILGISL